MRKIVQFLTGLTIAFVLWREPFRRNYRQEFELAAPTLQFPTVEQFQNFADFCEANHYDMEVDSVSLCFILSVGGQKRWLCPIEATCQDGPLPLYPLE